VRLLKGQIDEAAIARPVRGVSAEAATDPLVETG